MRRVVCGNANTPRKLMHLRFLGFLRIRQCYYYFYLHKTPYNGVCNLFVWLFFYCPSLLSLFIFLFDSSFSLMHWLLWITFTIRADIYQLHIFVTWFLALSFAKIFQLWSEWWVLSELCSLTNMLSSNITAIVLRQEPWLRKIINRKSHFEPFSQDLHGGFLMFHSLWHWDLPHRNLPSRRPRNPRSTEGTQSVTLACRSWGASWTIPSALRSRSFGILLFKPVDNWDRVLGTSFGDKEAMFCATVKGESNQNEL